MRAYLRQWYRRVTSRRNQPLNRNSGERPARPRLIYLEDKTVPSGTAQGVVFRDLNANGAFNPGTGETGVNNVTVTAYDSANAPQGAATTAADGSYKLTLGGTGPYRLEFTGIPAGLSYGVQGSQAGGPVQFVAEGGASDIGLALNTNALANANTPIEVGDRIWLDANGDGIQDASPNSGLGNVVVQLVDVNSNTVLGTVTTDPSGRFLFNSGTGVSTTHRTYGVALVPNGLYQLRVATGQSTLAGLSLSPFQVGSGPDSNLRDSDGQLDKSGTFAFATFSIGGFGQGNPNLDFGYTTAAPGTSTIGDFVWQDFNGDGIQDPNEPGLAGATVRLFDAKSNLLQTTVSGPSGNYLFSGVAPGDYRLDIALPAGYSLSPAFQGGDPLRDSDFDPTTGVTILFTVGANSAILDCDAGAIPAGGPTAALGDFVWFDANLNGIFDNNEIGVINTVVNLYDGSGTTLLGSTKTDAFGFYIFNNLNAGQYVVEFKPPTGFSFTIPNAGVDDQIDSDVDPLTGRTPVVTLTAGQIDLSIDAGLIKPTTGAIGDFVWIDLNCDGIFQPTENGLPGVTVNLLDNKGAVVKTTMTDANGRYFFTGLFPADYVVEFKLPPGFVFSPPNQGGDDQIDSDADPVTGRTPAITVTAGSMNTTIDAGMCPTANLGDFVWIDLNCDGIFQPSENGLAGVTVNLLDSAGNFISQTTTDAAGKYAFTNLPAANYIVEFVLPTGFVFSPPNQGGDDQIDSDADPLTGRTPIITLAPGQTDNSVDAGLCPTANLGDFVWIDLNCDGIFQPTEQGLAGVFVNLLDSAGNFISQTQTDAAGKYAFTDLPPASYIVEFTLPAGFVFSPPNQGGDDQIDSDADPLTGRTAVITLAPGETNNSIDAGLCPTTAALGDFVWFDFNCDGIQQPGEPGVANVAINLLDGGGNVIATTQTDANGKYAFTGLAPGDYQVQVTPPAGFFFSPQNAGPDPALNSDIDPATGLSPTVTLVGGQVNNDIDAGLCTTAALGDFVFLDANCDGIQQPGEDGVANVAIALLDANGNTIATTTSDVNGKYQFVGLNPGDYSVQFTLPAGFTFSPQNAGPDPALNSDVDPLTGLTPTITLISGQVNNDVDAGLCPATRVARVGDFVFLDLNCDGLQQPTDPGVAGVTVNLLDAQGNILATTFTDGAGKYLFDNLTPGNYQVQFTPPVGLAFTKANAGDPGLDSDVDPATGLTPVFTLAADQTDLTRDAGLVTLKDLSGFVYVDNNDNGVFEPGEAPIAGVTITLSGTNDLGAAVTATAQTGANGQYIFGGIRPGTYSLIESQPQGYLDGKDTPGTPFGGVVTINDVISDIIVDCDPANPSGVNYNFGEIAPSSLCGKVYWDLNNNGIPEPGEPGIAAVAVTISGTDNRGDAVSRTMVTGPDGTYLFTGLRAGTYVVTAAQSPFFDDGIDRAGTAGGVAGNDVISDIPLPAHFDACNYDFGEILPPGSGNKEELLASFQGGRSPNLFDYATLMPTSPTFANAIAETQLCSPIPARYVVTSADAGQAPVVRVFNYGSGTVAFEFNAYDPAFTGGVRVAVGDVTGDGVPDIITAPGAGGGPHIRVFDGSSGNVVAEFYAYDSGFTGGVYVTAGDVTGDGVAEIITGAGEGGGPHVKIFTGSGAVVNEYFAYDASFTGGVRVAVGNIAGAQGDVITAAGPGGGPHVRVFDGASASELYGFFAYDPNFTGGVYVAAGDVTGDGFADIVTGAGAGGGSHVRVFNGPTAAEVFGYFAYGSFTGGVRVGATDVNGDGKADVLTTPGVGLPTYTTVFDIQRAANLDAFLSFDPSVLTGAFVAGG